MIDEKVVIKYLESFNLDFRQKKFLKSITEGLPERASLYVMNEFVSEFMRGKIQESQKVEYACAWDRAKFNSYTIMQLVKSSLNRCNTCIKYDGMGECEKYQSRPPELWVESKNECRAYEFSELTYNTKVGFYFGGKKEDTK